MKKTLPYLLYCLMILSACTPKTEVTDMPQDGPSVMDKRNTGIATQLVGEVSVVSIYVEDGSRLSAKTKNAYAVELLKAEEWLVQEAAAHGVELQFANYQYGYQHAIEFRPTDGWYNVRPEEVIVATFGSEAAARLWFNRHPNCAVLIFSGNRKEQVCSAISIIRNYSLQHSFEGAKIFPHDMHEKSLAIAHEMLHLFGAWDLYAGPVHYKGGNYDLWFSHLQELRYADNNRSLSIMYDVEGSLSKHHVDDLTAYLIGWGGEWKDWYDPYAN